MCESEYTFLLDQIRRYIDIGTFQNSICCPIVSMFLMLESSSMTESSSMFERCKCETKC